MGVEPVPAVRLLLDRTGVPLDRIDLIELNEAFAAQGLARLRELGLVDDDPRVNPNGGAIALGHLLGMSGARLATTALIELELRGGGYALCTNCFFRTKGASRWRSPFFRKRLTPDHSACCSSGTALNRSATRP